MLPFFAFLSSLSVDCLKYLGSTSGHFGDGRRHLGPRFVLYTPLNCPRGNSKLTSSFFHRRYVGLSWLIGGSLQEVLTSIIFLFVKHPFDVGDRVMINTQTYTVKEIRLLSTVFLDSNNGVVQAPNMQLNTLVRYVMMRFNLSRCELMHFIYGAQFIQNMRRSPQVYIVQLEWRKNCVAYELILDVRNIYIQCKLFNDIRRSRKVTCENAGIRGIRTTRLPAYFRCQGER